MELSHLGSRIWYRGYIYAEQKINNKNRNKKTKDKRRSESVVLLGKEDEEKKKERNEGRKRGGKMEVEERFGYALWVHYQSWIDNENRFYC